MNRKQKQRGRQENHKLFTHKERDKKIGNDNMGLSIGKRKKT